MTQFGERPFQFDIGSRVRGLLFEPFDVFTAEDLRDEIENTIEAYLPVVKAIILMENGEQPYDDETILKGMNLAWESYRK